MVTDYVREIMARVQNGYCLKCAKSCRAPPVGIFSLYFSEVSLLFPSFCPTFWDYRSLLFAGKPVEAL